MPGRILPLVTNQFYHVFNRGVEHRPIFLNVKDYQRALHAMQLYQFQKPPVKLSRFLVIASEDRQKLLDELNKSGPKLVEIICFCLMPNHFHFLLRQAQDGGIAKFMSNFQNSFTRYFNIRHERDGILFQGQFKAKLVTTNEQLLHLSRYIHLNPHTSYVLKTLDSLLDYEWSSLPEYLGRVSVELCQKEIILSQFKSSDDYKSFVWNQADYQRQLDYIKHLTID